jgi:hypothetical protein
VSIESEELVAALPEVLRRAFRVRVYDQRGKVEPARKRRLRVASSLLLDLNGSDSLSPWTEALRIRPGTEIMSWMEQPELWIEFADDQGLQLVSLGLLRPDWLRWEPHGDLRLAVPEAVEDLIGSWGLDDAGA